MNDLRRTSLLEYMNKHFKDAPLSESLEIVGMVIRAEREAFDMKSALSVLTEPLGYDHNGGCPEELIRKFSKDRAVLSALNTAQYCHAWTVCGPVSDGMGLLKKEMAAAVASKSLFKSILDKIKSETVEAPDDKT